MTVESQTSSILRGKFVIIIFCHSMVASYLPPQLPNDYIRKIQL